jgi:hypothetical protein
VLKEVDRTIPTTGAKVVLLVALTGHEWEEKRRETSGDET